MTAGTGWFGHRRLVSPRPQGWAVRVMASAPERSIRSAGGTYRRRAGAFRRPRRGRPAPRRRRADLRRARGRMVGLDATPGPPARPDPEPGRGGRPGDLA